MYGYKTKHAILGACISLEFKNAKAQTKTLLEFGELHSVVSKGMNVDTFGRNLTYLEFEKYCDYQSGFDNEFICYPY